MCETRSLTRINEKCVDPSKLENEWTFKAKAIAENWYTLREENVFHRLEVLKSAHMCSGVEEFTWECGFSLST